jgi:uncharacterized protein with ATP-grasp and redox domains
MQLFFDCIPCFLRQSLDAIRLITRDEAVHEQVLRATLQTAAAMDLRESPPEMGQRIHRSIRAITGQVDPYREIKDRFNEMALNLYPTLQEWVDASDHPMETIVRLVTAANVIDFGARSELTEAEVRQAIMHSLSSRLDGELEAFTTAIATAKQILYLADNAGEIVFDRLLIERLPQGRVTVAVRGSPVINDATRSDAELAGIPRIAKVIDNGSDAPGTILRDCSNEFRQHFAAADLVIAKGQGNFETLNDVNKDIFFLLKAKCPVIARHLNCELNCLALRRARLDRHRSAGRSS